MAIDIVELVESKKTMSSKHSTILAVICLLIGSAIFIIAYLGMSQHVGLGQFNESVLSWMVNHRVESMTLAAKIITNLAGPMSLITFTAVIAIIWASFRRELTRPILLVISMAIAAGTSTLMKILIMDARPPLTDMIPTLEVDFSFPSGHTLAIIVFLLALGYLLYSRHFSKSKMIIWLIVAICGGGLIALTRLYLGYHWLTDVVASIGLGFVILAIIIAVDKAGLSRTKLN